jgi:hypothetical protein
MGQFYSIYEQFLGNFPDKFHWLVSLILAGLLAYAIFQTLRRNFIWLILLVILLPASVPILKNAWESVVQVIEFLVNKK